MPALYDVESGWKFAYHHVYIKEIQYNKDQWLQKLSEYIANSTLVDYKKYYQSLWELVYGAYGKYRMSNGPMNIGNFVVPNGWEKEYSNNNLVLRMLQNGHYTGGRAARISVQVDSQKLQGTVNPIQNLVNNICEVINTFLSDKPNTIIYWKFVDDTKICVRIDDIVIYVSSANADDQTEVLAKELSAKIGSVAQQNTNGIPGMKEYQKGIYMARECNGYDTRWYSEAMKQTFNAERESHGGSLAASFAFALLDSKWDFRIAKSIFARAFASFRDINNCFQFDRSRRPLSISYYNKLWS